MSEITYAAFVATAAYSCGKCGATGCKLWRQYQTFLDHQSLFCATCALRDQQSDGPVDANGLREWRPDPDVAPSLTDTIGCLVPAIPTWDGLTFWGYTSVPKEAVAWWRALPTILGAS